jgi:hypothetical protein
MDCSVEQSIFFMKLTFKIVLLSDDSVFLNDGLFALASLIAFAIATAVTLAVFAVIFAIALFAITLAVAAAGAAVQQFASPGNDAVTISGNNIDDTGNRSQSHNDLSNYFQSFHNKPSRFFMVSITSITN